MRLSLLKKQFEEELSGVYPSTEILSFFHILTEDFLGMNRLDIALDPEHEISNEQNSKFQNALERLKTHEPVQYITGNIEFFCRNFIIDKNVLIPRSETEELVEWILWDHRNESKNLKVLDIGTGSGCIPVSLKKELKNAQVYANDISSEALKIARKNAELNDAEVNFKKLDILETEDLEENFDIIVSNPPYVRVLEKKEMQNNVLDYEPEIALYVEDDDALIFYKKISELAKKFLNKGGVLYFEINQYLPEETKSLVENLGFEAELKKDIFGNYRLLKATMK